ncbi:hydrolase TatD [Dolosicoccus paucivorans]|uniref:Hydrolase TatD n=1 Tax=Dolosicoccus paucivorans TaxID=84521 RepID=A0A2N6SLD4_9LACT|nr:TatD family hydrolase [Dolosicoccus paucivorans]PMB83690.1 hydrolase TatD [Dolosicoccus paucivorans]PMC57873.1 hydrolase TatD [Dolosicoccus paucivorans]
MKLFDTHTHLNVEQFDGIEDDIIRQAWQNDVNYMAVVGFDEATILKSLELSEQYDSLISVVGWHPNEAGSYNDAVEEKLRQWLQHPKVKMLGEIGLDYHWNRASKEVQERVFRRQINLAKELEFPITIHNREATEDVYRILKDEGLPKKGGIMHSFGGTPEEVQQFIDLGMHISFSGVLTFKKSDDVRQAAKMVPMDRLLIETDAPFLAPVPKRGKRNEPGYVKYVAEVLADVKGVSVEEIARITTENAFNLFGWRPEDD